MIKDDDVLEFWSKGAKGVLIHLKRHKKMVDQLLTKYLKELPLVGAKLTGGSGHTEYPCDMWIRNLSLDMGLHCEHCVHKQPCASQCLQAYEDFLGHFCSLCVQEDKSRCKKSVIKSLEKALKNRSNYSPPIKPGYHFITSMKFRITPSQKNYAYKVITKFTIPRIHARPDVNSDGQSKSLSDILLDLITTWIDPPRKEEIGERRLLEIALSIVSFNHAFFSDLLHGRLFLNTPYTNLEVLYQGNPDPNENSVEFDEEMARRAAELLLDIYRTDYLPSLSIRVVDVKYKKAIKSGEQKEIISSSNEKHTSDGFTSTNYYDPQIEPKYLQYQLYHKLAQLVSGALAVRFTTKIALPFRGNNLMRLKDALRIHDTFKDACKAISLRYKTVHSGICNNIIHHPRYQEYINLKYSGEVSIYGLLGNFISESTDAEISAWNDKVHVLLK